MTWRLSYNHWPIVQGHQNNKTRDTHYKRQFGITELAKTFFFCLTLGQTGTGVLSYPWALCLSHHFFVILYITCQFFFFYTELNKKVFANSVIPNVWYNSYLRFCSKGIDQCLILFLNYIIFIVPLLYISGFNQTHLWRRSRHDWLFVYILFGLFKSDLP
jgi:hypothetical protein